MFENEMYLVVILFSTRVGTYDRLVTARRAITLIGLDAVARFTVDWNNGEEFTVFGWDGNISRELNEAEFAAWETYTNKNKGVKNG